MALVAIVGCILGVVVMTDVFLPKYEDALFLMKIREVVEARSPEVSPELLVRVEVARSRAEDANESLMLSLMRTVGSGRRSVLI